MTMKRLNPSLILSQIAFFALLPFVTSAQDASFGVPHVIGLFNIFVGLMLTAAFLFFGTGFIVYIVRLGTVHREQGIRIMEKGIITLFVLVVLVALVRFFQSHPVYATLLLSGLVTVAIVFIVIFTAATQGGGEKKPARPERK